MLGCERVRDREKKREKDREGKREDRGDIKGGSSDGFVEEGLFHRRKREKMKKREQER